MNRNERHFRFWAQHVIPLVYDDSLSYYEVLCKCRDYINQLIDENEQQEIEIQQNAHDIDVLEGRADVLEDRMDTAETDIDNLEDRATSLEGRMDTAEDDIDSLENRATSLEGRMDTAEDDIDSLEGRATSLEGRMSTAEGDIDSLEGRATSLEGRMTTAESDIDAVENRATSLEGRMTTAERDIDAVENRATSLEGRMTTAESDIDAVENRATSLEGRMTTAESDIDAVENRATALEGRVNTAEDDIDDIETELQTVITDISELQDKDILIATLIRNPLNSDNYTIDKTFAEIYAKLEDGGTVYLKHPWTSAGDNFYLFSVKQFSPATVTFENTELSVGANRHNYENFRQIVLNSDNTIEPIYWSTDLNRVANVSDYVVPAYVNKVWTGKTNTDGYNNWDTIIKEVVVTYDSTNDVYSLDTSLNDIIQMIGVDKPVVLVYQNKKYELANYEVAIDAATNLDYYKMYFVNLDTNYDVSSFFIGYVPDATPADIEITYDASVNMQNVSVYSVTYDPATDTYTTDMPFNLREIAKVYQNQPLIRVLAYAGEWYYFSKLSGTSPSGSFEFIHLDEANSKIKKFTMNYSDPSGVVRYSEVSLLPTTTVADAGKVLQVSSNGNWEVADNYFGVKKIIDDTANWSISVDSTSTAYIDFVKIYVLNVLDDTQSEYALCEVAIDAQFRAHAQIFSAVTLTGNNAALGPYRRTSPSIFDFYNITPRTGQTVNALFSVNNAFDPDAINGTIVCTSSGGNACGEITRTQPHKIDIRYIRKTFISDLLFGVDEGEK